LAGSFLRIYNPPLMHSNSSSAMRSAMQTIVGHDHAVNAENVGG
jgi:hypothetical protein